MATAGQRTRNIFDPTSEEPFKLSRSKIELFLQCPRCFYLDRHCGIDRIGSPAYSLNNAVDTLLKREFDLFRKRSEPHTLMEAFGVEAIPLAHPLLEDWRDSRKGIQYLHEQTNFLVFGAVDDLWIDIDGKIIVVDYKATSSEWGVSIDGNWKKGYKRQLEIYQWLFAKNGFSVSPTGYFVYANADAGKESFDGKLEFVSKILPYTGDFSWVDEALQEAKICLIRDSVPLATEACEWCAYRRNARGYEKD